ncbi:MAG: hypothetical protein WCV72_03465 [Patescibacteria group bacterium]
MATTEIFRTNELPGANLKGCPRVLDEAKASRPEAITGSKEKPRALEAKTSTQEAIANLKNDTEAARKAREFLNRQGFALEIETRIDAMKLLPDLPHRKAIYEQMFFSQKNGTKIIVAGELKNFFAKNPNAKDDEVGKLANEAINGWLATLATLDHNHDGKLNYEEIMPDNAAEAEFIERVFGALPFCTKLKHNPDFQNATTEVDAETKKRRLDFVANYLAEYAATLIDPQTNEAAVGSGRELSRVLQSISLSTVGGVFLKNEDFKTRWDELVAKDAVVAKVFAEGNDREQTKFENLLEKDDLKIRRMRMDADEAMLAAVNLEKSNPYGFALRKYGDGTSLLLYNGSNLLLTTIGLNVALSGFDPEKIVKNPIMWVMVAGLYAGTKHFNPNFMSGASPAVKAERDDLKEKFRDAPQPVQDWITLFSKKDLDPKEPLGKLLIEKNRSAITSEELAVILDKSNRKDKKPSEDIKILANSDDAHKAFLFLRACQQRELNPKTLLDA